MTQGEHAPSLHIATRKYVHAHRVCLSRDKSDDLASVRNGCGENDVLRTYSDGQTLLQVLSFLSRDQCRSRRHVTNRKLREKRLTKKAGNRDSRVSLSFACVSQMVASPSYMDSESSRRSSTSWTSIVSSISSTTEASSSISRSKAAVKSDSSSHDSSSSELVVLLLNVIVLFYTIRPAWRKTRAKKEQCNRLCTLMEVAVCVGLLGSATRWLCSHATSTGHGGTWERRQAVVAVRPRSSPRQSTLSLP